MRYSNFLKVQTTVPLVKTGDINFNVNEISKAIQSAGENGVDLLLLPELCLTGYACGDLFFQNLLLTKSMEALQTVLKTSTAFPFLTLTIGGPFRHKNNLYNVAYVIKNGTLLGIVPKLFIPNHREFNEKRWFVSGFQLNDDERTFPYVEVKVLGQECGFGVQLFDIALPNDESYRVAVEICADFWSPYPPSINYGISNADVILNLSASDEVVGKRAKRIRIGEHLSFSLDVAYLYVSSGIYESTSELVFGGHAFIAENGAILEESSILEATSQTLSSFIDLNTLRHTKITNDGYIGRHVKSDIPSQWIDLPKKTTIPDHGDFTRQIQRNPYLPTQKDALSEALSTAWNIQVMGLFRRIEHIGIKHLVLGISGGLDSTLALLVCVEAFKRANIPTKNIVCVFMPGFGTSKRTHSQAQNLSEYFGCSYREISIETSVLDHFKAIGQDPNIQDITYENSQARERTQILMDLANKEGAIVVGTGDMSEIALGWCTYNGDQMSMYNVNAGIPKTVIPFILRYVAEESDSASPALLDLVNAVIKTPISPELLPPDTKGEISQKTEEKTGPYELHDFFLYHMVHSGDTPEKIVFLAELAFKDIYDKKTIVKWLKYFYSRFFSQQFKRSASPDGPMVFSFSLSPKGAWRMASDISAKIWLDSLG